MIREKILKNFTNEIFCELGILNETVEEMEAQHKDDHFVAETYLRSFCEENDNSEEKVYTININVLQSHNKCNIRPMNISKICYEKGGSVNNYLKDTNLSIEGFLKKSENGWRDCIKFFQNILQQGSFTSSINTKDFSESKEIIAHYIACMQLINPELRRINHEFYNKKLKDDRMSQAVFLCKFDELKKDIYNSKWCFIYNPTSYPFITSSLPLCPIRNNSYKQFILHYDIEGAFKKERANKDGKAFELYIPLAPNLAVSIIKDEDRTLEKMKYIS